MALNKRQETMATTALGAEWPFLFTPSRTPNGLDDSSQLKRKEERCDPVMNEGPEILGLLCQQAVYSP